MPPTDEQILRIERTLEKITILISGNDLDDNDSGLAGVVDTISKRLVKIERTIDRAKWVFYGVAFTTGYGVAEFISDMFTIISRK